MRIAVIRKRYGTGGGAERYAAALVEGLAARGHQVAVFAEKFDAATVDGVNWMPVQRARTFAARGAAGFHLRAQKALGPMRGYFDVVYGLSRSYPLDVFRVTEQLHAEWLPIGYPWWQKWNPRHRALLRLEKHTLDPRNVRRVVTNSELVRGQVVGLFNFPADRVGVLRNGVDHDVFYPAADEVELASLRAAIGFDSGERLLLFAAADFRIKGLAAAIAAVSGLPEPERRGVRLLVVGGDNPKPYINQARRLGIAENLVFLGRRRGMRELYAAADLLVYPSLYEPFANVCLEACACGLPVLTTARNGAAEMLTHGVNGYIVPDASATAAITTAIHAHLAMPRRQTEAFAAAAAAAAAAYRWDSHVGQLEKILIEAANERNR